jgi:hypothetical protein
MRLAGVVCVLLSGASDNEQLAGRALTDSTKTIQFSVNDAVLIEVDTGQTAIISFAAVTRHESTYRWKYRRAPGSPATTGQGHLRERYRHVAWHWTWTWPPWQGLSEEVAPLPDNETTVRAGEINVEWSTRAYGEGYLYFDPDHISIRLLPAQKFDAWS